MALSCFRMPTPVSITGRSSSITNCFASAIIPVIHPTAEEVSEALAILALNADDLRCAYCGDVSTEWDHLRPLIVGQRPTGYVSEIKNLVPACGKCNQSKGNKPWRDWIESNAPRSPKARGLDGMQDRITRLEAYERWGSPRKIDFEDVLGSDLWAEHWKNWSAVIAELRKAQEFAKRLQSQIAASTLENSAA
jgi:hypothetical protein